MCLLFNMEYIVDFQGFKQPHDKFVVKEFSAITVQEDFQYFALFKPPCQLESLPEQYQRINHWMIRNFHGLPWESGDVPYNDFKPYINHILKSAKHIYVKGLDKKKWLEHILEKPTIIINMQDIQCPSLKKFKTSEQLHPHQGMQDYNCAYENVLHLRTWLKVFIAGDLEGKKNLLL